MGQSSGTIVVGIDGSASSKQALEWAVDQAVAEHRALTLVLALGDPTPAWTDTMIADPHAAYAALRADGQKVVDEARAVAEHRAPGLEIREVMEFVDARALLIEQSRDAAMLVLGSRGRGRVRTLLLGSVGVALARHTACPTVIHRPWNPGVVRQGILVAADGTEQSRPVLEFAYHQAELLGLPLTVLHCFWDVQSATTNHYLPLPTADIESERLELAESIAGMAEKYPDVKVTTTVARGMPEARVALDGERMNLVVVGAHQGSRAQQLMFGSVSVQVVEHATCPVAVIPVGSASA